MNADGGLRIAECQRSHLPKGHQKIQIKVLDMTGNIASVKVVSARFVDYLQWGKLNGEWRIINILTEVNPASRSSQ